jgi:hypothetical protein
LHDATLISNEMFRGVSAGGKQRVVWLFIHYDGARVLLQVRLMNGRVGRGAEVGAGGPRSV